MRQDDKSVGELLKSIMQKSKAGFDSMLRDSDITSSQSQILYLILDNKHQKVTQRFLTQITGLTHPTIIGILKRLEAKGFVVTYNDADDRRVKVVEATPKASAMEKSLAAQREKMDEVLLSGFDADEERHLRALLARVDANLDRMA